MLKTGKELSSHLAFFELCAAHRRRCLGFTRISRTSLSSSYLLGLSQTKKLFEHVIFWSCQDTLLLTQIFFPQITHRQVLLRLMKKISNWKGRPDMSVIILEIIMLSVTRSNTSWKISDMMTIISLETRG